MVIFLLVILWICVPGLQGQGVPLPDATVALQGYAIRSSIVPANSSATLLDFTVEASTTASQSFEVATSNSSVAVSLVLPSGTEVTEANAASLGFTFTVIPDGTLTSEEVPSMLSLPGTHTLIDIPAGQPAGTYRIKANAASVAADSGIIATYYPASNVRATASTNAANYKPGDTVVLSGLVFNGTTPVTGATVTAAVSVPVPLTQATITAYQLVSQQSINANLTRYTYTATLTNNGAAAQEVEANLATIPSNVIVLNDTLVFGNVAASSSTISLNTIAIERNPSQTFNLTTLQWKVSTPGTPVNVTLTDSGSFDAAAGDGIYTGTFTPPATGEYTALMSINGTSTSGNFMRTAVTEFEVTQALASFGTFADSLQPEGVSLVANVTVQTAGSYSFDIELKASNSDQSARQLRLR